MKNLNRNHHYVRYRFACLELKGRTGRMLKFIIARLLFQMGLVFKQKYGWVATIFNAVLDSILPLTYGYNIVIVEQSPSLRLLFFQLGHFLNEILRIKSKFV